MPMIRIATNLADVEVPRGFELRFADVVSKSTGKPREVIAVEIAAGARLIQGGTNDPVAVISIESIGAVSDEDNIRHSAAISAIFEAELGIPKGKVIISFYDLAPGKVAIDGTTVANATPSLKSGKGFSSRVGINNALSKFTHLFISSPYLVSFVFFCVIFSFFVFSADYLQQRSEFSSRISRNVN